MNKGSFKKGHLPHNKERECPKKLKKVEKFKLGLPIECKRHGEHLKWRIHTGNNVQCFYCAADWQMAQRRRNPLRFIFRDAKRHAISHKREFNITLEYLQDILILQKNKCALTGIDFDENVPPSLDRINSSKGYIIGNIQLIQIKINIMKSNLDQNHFMELCKQVIAYSEAGEKRKKKSRKK